MTEQLKQALEALKVAEYRMRTSGDRHSDSYGKVDFAINTLERALTTSQPAQAGEVDLHAAIMNLPCDGATLDWANTREAYQYGHRAARHAAAELVLAATQPAAQATPSRYGSPDLQAMIVQHATQQATPEPVQTIIRQGFTVDVSPETVARLQANRAAFIAELEGDTPEPLHLFEFWWESHMPQATQAQAWAAWTDAQNSKGAAIDAAQPATPEPVPKLSDYAPEIAARLRHVAELAGCADAVPANDLIAVGFIFSVLGNMRRALELKQATQQAAGEPVGEVWIQPDHLQKARVAPHLCRVAPTRIAPDFVPLSTHPAPAVPDVEDLRDRLVAISAAVADCDDRAAQSMLGEILRLLAAAQAKGGAA